MNDTAHGSKNYNMNYTWEEIDWGKRRTQTNPRHLCTVPEKISEISYLGYTFATHLKQKHIVKILCILVNKTSDEA